MREAKAKLAEDRLKIVEDQRRLHEDRMKMEEEQKRRKKRGTGENTWEKELSRQSFLRVQTLTFLLKRVFSF